MGTRSCIIWRAIHEDNQETQTVTVKANDGHLDRVKEEIQSFYNEIISNKIYGLKDSEFLANEFVKINSSYQVTREWWLYDNFFFVTVKSFNPNFDWRVGVFSWKVIDEYCFGVKNQ